MADEPCDLVIEYTIDGGQTWHHGKTVPAWVGRDPQALRIQRAAVREDALAEHGEGSVRTRVLPEDDPRCVLSQPPAPDPRPATPDPGGLGLAGPVVMTFGSREEMLAWADQVRREHEAELAAGGVHPVAVVHGDPETELDARLHYTDLHQLADEAAARHGARMTGTRGGNDYTTYFFAGSGAAEAALAFQAAAEGLAAEHDRRWWNVTLTAYPQFGR